jgi:hypothetical protein
MLVVLKLIDLNNMNKISFIFSANGVCIIDTKYADCNLHELLECAKRDE